ncbi:MAG TPA: leucine--tRNA ligase, partial [Sphingomicrobium sp.]|nr:leucine--tRNA ligase [Sphingomicrobium sp.]
MTGRFDPAVADVRWQKRWEDERCFIADTNSGKPKTYVLEMFPYPSGRIHMGHVRNYTMGDVLARYRRMQGFEVLHPMGWDAFGMPAENAAMERGVHPDGWTRSNIAAMRDQLKRLGFALDWSREVATCDPEYYGHEQALFLDLYEAGLVYRKESEVNWDPVDHTVLANEQVIDGKGWRSGAPVERRKLSQWFLKITDFADELVDGLKTLDDWPDKVKLMQENWIGRSDGLRFRFKLVGEGAECDYPWIKAALARSPEVEVFTTRPDTIFGASFVAVSPDHPFAEAIASQNPDAARFIADCKSVGTSEEAIESQQKRGFATGLEAIHPLDPEWRLPVWIANFVLMEYGTGAIFGVPAHDQRDFEFAREYDLPIRRVVARPDQDKDTPIGDEAEHGEGVIVNSGFLDGLSVEEAQDAVIRRAEKDGWGKRETAYRLRDWGVSRQRYWGTPIPMIHCSGCGPVPVPREQLPVLLP